MHHSFRYADSISILWWISNWKNSCFLFVLLLNVISCIVSKNSDLLIIWDPLPPYPYFMDEENEAEKWLMTCLKLDRKTEVVLVFELILSHCRMYAQYVYDMGVSWNLLLSKVPNLLQNIVILVIKHGNYYLIVQI